MGDAGAAPVVHIAKCGPEIESAERVDTVGQQGIDVQCVVELVILHDQAQEEALGELVVHPGAQDVAAEDLGAGQLFQGTLEVLGQLEIGRKIGEISGVVEPGIV